MAVPPPGVLMRALRLSFLLICALSASAVAQPAARRPGKAAKLDVAKVSAVLLGADLAAATRAAAQLGGAPSEAAHEAVLDALATGLHPDVAVAGLTALGTNASKTDLQLIGAYIRHRNPAVRAAALRAFLASIGEPALVAESLSSYDAGVRAVAAEAAGRMQLKETIPALLILLDKGEEAAAVALGKMANEDLARTVAEHFGTAPDVTLAKALGVMLARKDFGNEATRLDVIRTVNKLGGPEAIAVLEAYVASTPALPPKQSRREAEAGIKEKLGGDK